MIPKQQPSFDELSTEGKNTNPDSSQWNPAQSPIRIEYSNAVLSEARDLSVAGLRRLARGGMEVAGVFYGTHSTSEIKITALRPISCEYKSGPVFALSDVDKAKLREQLVAAAEEPELKELSVVGWFISHPRGDVTLGDRDLEIYNEFFPDIDQVVLVLKPTISNVRAGFFVREPRGLLQCNESYLEFDLGMPRSKEGASAIREIAEQAQGAKLDDWDPVQRRRGLGGIAEMPMPHPPPNVRGERTRIYPQTYVPPQQPPQQTPPQVPSQSAGGGAAVAPAKYRSDWSPAVARPRAVILAQMANDRRRRLQWRWLILWAGAMAVLIGCIVLYRVYTAPTPLGLRVVEKGEGGMLVQWDTTSRTIKWGSAGKLGIRGVDGSHTEIALQKDQLALGAYLYQSQVGDVLIRLSVDNRYGFPAADESTRYVPRAGAEETKPTSLKKMDKQSLQNEFRRMQEELNRNQERIKELETLLYNR